MTHLFQQIESGSIQPAQGLIIAAISVALILGFCYLLTKTEKAK